MKRTIGIIMVLLMLMSVTFAWAGNAKDTETGGEKVKVIIGYGDKPNQADEDVIRGHGGKTKYTYRIINAKAAELPEQAIDRIKNNPRVAYVEEDAEVYILDMELNNSWGVKRIGAGEVHDSGNTGAGVKVAIIDTGIDYDHPDLNGSYKGGYDFGDDDDDPMDIYGHGTYCAGIVAAEDNGEGVVGVAPNASLYAVKVMDARGRVDWSDVIAGIQWSVTNDMQVISMSFGGPGPLKSVADACDAAYDAGIVLVAAAGNRGNPPGEGDMVNYPAAYSSVIAVAATDINDERAYRSSTGPDVELAAPGDNISSTFNGGYLYTSGTSVACPHVAGTVALVIAANPGWNNSQVRQQLRDTAEDLGTVGFDYWYGYGLVNASAASAPVQTMHVDSVEMSLENRGVNVNAVAIVTIVDANDNPVVGATVDGHCECATSDDDTGTTDAVGQVILRGKVKKSPSETTFTFAVDGVTKTDWSYVPSENVVTDNSTTV